MIMCIMGAAIALVLQDRRDAVFILISVFIIFCTTATLCLVFVPKVRLVVPNFSISIEYNAMPILKTPQKFIRTSIALYFLKCRLKLLTITFSVIYFSWLK